MVLILSTMSLKRATRTSLWLLACGCAALLFAGCSLKPGCANRDAKAAIEKDARSSVELWLKSIGAPTLLSKAIFQLGATYETGRAGDTRSCSGSMSIKMGADKVEVPITYEVIGTDDGSTMYRWDGPAFGKSFIAQALTGGLASAIEKAAEPPAPSPQEATPSTENDRADRTANAMKRWRNEVSDTITAEVGRSNVEGSGTVGVAFTVSDSGVISNVRVTRSSGNAALDSSAVKIVEKVGSVTTPPNMKEVAFTLKLAFL